ncbi:conserved hypothetical protein [Bacteroides xylanisolvens SD CC 2a]|uniref:Primase C-terminal 2 domain-containing protein n=1 Tax=Bacteroides xylanisolvens SD CC 1b TaxID=702447 RepID=D4VM21_9BACE|nr:MULTISPECIES: DUF3987 domain-containing protein [Bacteroides]EEO49475.1 hypothetical protein BSAG_01186 [Bacteroides sp. D1]EEZ03549.1 hypothetical protein HMPREF0102_02611 [Bacteroides sp. 2_1_22]EFF59068.1 conserved hypothetical protein [Bacteroides xylanisolvens SD CC 2a]EFG13061.1 conserved hypothetical protein [Bacteroides xylanisolvens SD CC 1b]CDL99813.1 FIG00896590: hypothetical protein [Bacteroides xylanisolvens SD CC 2a]
MTDIESLRRLTEAVETAGADIAPTYAEYVQLAFAIATDCGEAGREFFHRLCRTSAKYQREHAERIFSNALTTRHGEVHLGTAFHLAEMANVKLCNTEVMNNRRNTENTENTPSKVLTHAHVYNKVENDEPDESEELLNGSDPNQPLPTFPEADWPKILLLIMSYATSPTQRDVMLLGALTAIGASMERYVRCPYAGKLQSPCLQSFIVAPSASGKGILSLIRLLVEPIHDEIRQQVATEVKAYKKEKAAYDVMGKERSKVEAPQMPKNRMFLISGNNTGTGILQNIMDANGTGLICETKADTISAAIGSEYGHWSDTLRKAFDHDRLSYNRRTDQEYREVKKSYLSVLLSGTPAQVKPLIPSTENGLFSRQLFYYMHGIWAWINQFESGEADLEAIFTDIGLEWKKQLDLMKTHGVHTLRLTDEQKQEFNTLFSDLFFRSGLANDNEMSSSIARLAVNTCRIMAEVAMIRALECDQPYQFKNSSIHLLTPDKEIATDNIKDGIITRWDVTITAEDFKAVLELVTPLYRHATHILSFLPSTEVKHRANADRDALFEAMGNQFTRAQLSEQATIMKIKPNTAFGWLNRLIKKGLFTNADDKGIYTRTHVCVC